MAARVENIAMRKKCRTICVDASLRACINCVWYEQYYRQNRGNVSAYIPVSTGICLLDDSRNNPLRRACREFEYK